MDLPETYEQIRKNWHVYLAYGAGKIPDDQFDAIWDDWCAKFRIQDIVKKRDYMIILKQFIMNEKINNPNVQMINNQSIKYYYSKPHERVRICNMADILGLHHERKSQSRHRDDHAIYIHKPNIWAWEFSEKNPYVNRLSHSNQMKKAVELQKEHYYLNDKYNCERLVESIGNRMDTMAMGDIGGYDGFLDNFQFESVF